MLRASFGKVVHTVKRAGTYAAKVPPQELHKIAVHVRAVFKIIEDPEIRSLYCSSFGIFLHFNVQTFL
jgi:hypothetical protein